MKKNKGITLISLVITIIILIILAGIAINLSIGENGIFRRARQAKVAYAQSVAKEKVELVLLDALIEKNENSEYNSEDFLDDMLEESGIEVNGDEVTVDNYTFTIDREELKIVTENGESNIKVTKEVKSYKGKNTNGKYEAEILVIIESDKELQSIEIRNPDGTTFAIETNKTKIAKDMVVEFDEVYKVIVTTKEGKEEKRKIIEKSQEMIRTVEELVEFKDKVNKGLKYEGKTLKLGNDIDLSSVCGENLKGKDVNWEPIGYLQNNKKYWFDGTFNGNGNKITNLYIKYDYDIDDSEEKTQGLFGLLGYKGKVENLIVEGKIESGNSDRATGGIVGRNEGIIENCINNTEVNNAYYAAAGICGINYNTVNNCTNKANIYGLKESAGIVLCNLANGDNYVTMNSETPNPILTNCTNEGNITTDGTLAGGIVGMNEGRIENCKNKGNVISNIKIISNYEGIGGIAGITRRNINKCANIENIIKGRNWTGGIAGYANKGVEIKESYNYNSNIEVTEYAVGGIVGRIESGSIENSYNILSEENYIRAGQGNAGGIAGTCITNLLVKNCYNIGSNIFVNIPDNTFKGLIIGQIQNYQTSIENCYYDKESSLEIVQLNGYTLKLNTSIPKELSQFKLALPNENSVVYGLNRYIDSDIWGQDNSINEGYPYLKENI